MDGNTIEYEIIGREIKIYQVMAVNAVLLEEAKEYHRLNLPGKTIPFGLRRTGSYPTVPR